MAGLAETFLWLVAICVLVFWIYPSLVEPRTRADRDQSTSRIDGVLDKGKTAQSGDVFIVQLTDDGEVVQRSQVADITYAVRHLNKEPVLSVWYIHGWKHNANEGDSDRKNFTALVQKLKDEQDKVPAALRRHVVGIYIGWDAAAGPWFLRDLTFWNRKRAADQISQSGIVTKLFARVRSARSQRAHPDDLNILIGHSFGARILFSAASHVLIDETERQHPGEKEWGYKPIQGPADLVLLLNPAFEASMFTALHAMRRDDDYLGIDSQQQPRLLAISTENDRPTRVYFPIGQIIGLAMRSRQRTTLGNYAPYITHDLAATCERAQRSDFWYDHFEANGQLLLHRKERRGPNVLRAAQWGNPFLVARTTRSIVDGHSKIWEPILIDWLIGFVIEVHKRSPGGVRFLRRYRDEGIQLTGPGSVVALGEDAAQEDPVLYKVNLESASSVVPVDWRRLTVADNFEANAIERCVRDNARAFSFEAATGDVAVRFQNALRAALEDLNSIVSVASVTSSPAAEGGLTTTIRYELLNHIRHELVVNTPPFA